MNVTTLIFWTLVGVSAIFLGVASLVDLNEANEFDVQLEHYCDMVQIGVDSDGEYGWPDFKGIAEEQCK